MTVSPMRIVSIGTAPRGVSISVPAVKQTALIASKLVNPDRDATVDPSPSVIAPYETVPARIGG